MLYGVKCGIGATMLMLFTSGCFHVSENEMTSKEAEVLEIAKNYITVHYPQFDNTSIELSIEDKGDTWEVTYELPELTLGGAPVIVVEKISLEVQKAYHTQ